MKSIFSPYCCNFSKTPGRLFWMPAFAGMTSLARRSIFKSIRRKSEFRSYLLATPPNAYDTVPFLNFLMTRTAFVSLIGAFLLDVVNRNQGVLLLIPGYLALGAAEFADRILDVSFAGATPSGPNGSRLYSFRISKKIRGLACRDNSWLRILSLHADHDAAYE